MASQIPINGEVLRDLRALRLLSQEQLAHAAGCTREEISAYERGTRKPRPAQLDRIVTALERYPVKAAQWLLIQTPALDKVLAMIEGPMNRRELVKLLTAGAGTGGVVLAPLDLGEFSLHQATQDLIDRWPTATPAESLTAARDLLNRQSHELKMTAMTAGERRQVLIDAVDTAILAGWSARFADLPAEQAAWFTHAAQLADEIGLNVIRGEVLASQATLHRPSPWGDGNVLAGLELARAAEPLVGARGPLAKFVVSLQSEMYVALDEDDSLRALDRALALPDGGGRGFYSHQGVFSEWATEQQQWAGDRYAQLGRPDEASSHLDEAMRIGFVSPRTPVQIQASKTLAHAIAGNPEPMCYHAHLTLDGSLATGYEAGTGRVRDARAQLPDPCADVACVRELDERLATV
jgi:transcriptional regulator with XRE-family HTH domain